MADRLQAPGYAADLAGITYDISCSLEDILVKVSGYSDRLEDVLYMILREILDLKIEKDRFEVVIEKIKRAYDNAYIRQSGEMSDLFLGQALGEKLFPAPDRRRELEHTTLDTVASHAGRVFEKGYFTVLIHGNISQERAVETMQGIENMLPSRPLVPSEHISPRSLLVPPNANIVLVLPVPNVKEENSAISYLCVAGSASHKPTRAMISLLSTMMSEPFFHTMRTLEQLGYNVKCDSWSRNATSGDIGMRFRVQSTRHPEYLESRIEAFLQTYLMKLGNMTPSEFDEHKRGVVDRKRKKLVNLGEEYARFWSHIDTEDLEFDEAEQDAQIIEGLALEQVVDFFKQKIYPSQTRQKLSVYLVSTTASEKLKDEMAASISQMSRKVFTDLAELRAGLRVSVIGDPDL